MADRTDEDHAEALFTPGGRKYFRIRYGSEADDWGANRRPCHDCRVKKGEHHIWGCGVERCPKCRGQLFSCSCNFEDDAPAEEE